MHASLRPFFSRFSPAPRGFLGLLCAAAIGIGCPGSDSSDDDPVASTSATGAPSPSASEGATPGVEASTVTGDDSSGPSTGSGDTSSREPTSSTGETDDASGGGACPGDAECSGPEDTSCPGGGNCLACLCVGGEPEPLYYGRCGECESDETEAWLDFGYCACAPSCAVEACPPLPPEAGLTQKAPSCETFFRNVDACVVRCSFIGENFGCPFNRTCTDIGERLGVCGSEPV